MIDLARERLQGSFFLRAAAGTWELHLATEHDEMGNMFVQAPSCWEAMFLSTFKREEGKNQPFVIKEH